MARRKGELDLLLEELVHAPWWVAFVADLHPHYVEVHDREAELNNAPATPVGEGRLKNVWTGTHTVVAGGTKRHYSERNAPR